ncbi:S-adenosyl-L-methionine-dependent methyltransferase [Dipodascopsis uninucleata]
MADLSLSEVDRLQTKEYWDQRYQKDEDNTTFDWFKSFDDIRQFLEKHIPWIDRPDLRVLMLGCGNSTLSKDMYDAGCKNIANVDFSETCIKQMMKLHENKSEMSWHIMDVRDMNALEDESFDIAIDKGTLDAFLSYTGSVWDIPEDIKESACKYMDETNRVLKKDGKLLYISYRQPHFAKPIINRPYWNMSYEVLSDLSGGGFDYFGYLLDKNR